MRRAIGAAAFLLLLLPAPAWATGGGHGGPTPTCRKGCKPLSPEQVRQLRHHPEQLPPGVDDGRGR